MKSRELVCPSFRPFTCWLRCLGVLVACLALAAPALGATCQSEDTIVEINHEGGMDSAGRIRLATGERLCVRLTDTNQKCFDFGSGFEVTTTPETAGSGEYSHRNDTVIWRFAAHDRDISAYEVEAKNKSDKPECSDLPERKWRIPVETHGFTLAFSGAFVGEELTDPVYFLDEKEEKADDGSTVFTVSENVDARDDFELGIAAMVHLTHSDPEWMNFGGVSWAPLTFGIGIDSSKANYYLGTSFNFSDNFFLTLGYVFGPEERLPGDLKLGDEVTDPNVLGDTLPTRNTDAFFVGLSYSFIETKPLFEKGFKTQKPSGDGGT